jgi:hypothetical protein
MVSRTTRLVAATTSPGADGRRTAAAVVAGCCTVRVTEAGVGSLRRRAATIGGDTAEPSRLDCGRNGAAVAAGGSATRAARATGARAGRSSATVGEAVDVRGLAETCLGAGDTGIVDTGSPLPWSAWSGPQVMRLGERAIGIDDSVDPTSRSM